jgi:hypothetical protein
MEIITAKALPDYRLELKFNRHLGKDASLLPYRENSSTNEVCAVSFT